MGKVSFVAAGQWKHGLKGKLGVKLYRYDSVTGNLILSDTAGEHITAGQICINEAKNVLYVVDEVGNIRGDLGGGGYISAFRIDTEAGKLKFINERRTLLPYPCFVSLDPSGEYLLVSHNGDHGHVTKIIRTPDGGFTSETVYDDAAIVLFRLGPDGSTGDICDISICPNGTAADAVEIKNGAGIAAQAGIMAHVHSISSNRDGSLYAACDMGRGIIYTYHIDRKNGKLVRLGETRTDPAYLVRYGVFHPSLRFFYANCEKASLILAYGYDENTGKLSLKGEFSTVYDTSEGMDPGSKAPDAGSAHIEAGANDILIDPSGKHLYCSNIDGTISVMDILDDGCLSLKQLAPCGGIRPRAICLTPDRAYLMSGNNRSGDITMLSVGDDGRLSETGRSVQDVLPSAIRAFAKDMD